jgi:hypothetical protein
MQSLEMNEVRVLPQDRNLPDMPQTCPIELFRRDFEEVFVVGYQTKITEEVKNIIKKSSKHTKKISKGSCRVSAKR